MKKLITLFAAALALVACSRQEKLDPQERDLTVRFSTQQLSNYAFKSALEANDKVGVFASQPIEGVNVQYTATAEKQLSSATPLKWIKGNTTPVDFVAYRPYDAAVTSTTLVFAAQADQSKEGAYDASDLMAATASQVEPETVVPLIFKHQLSKVAVKLTNNVEGTTISGVIIEDVSLGAHVNLVSGAITDVADKASVKAAAAANQYEAIIIPQTAKPAIVVGLSNGVSYKFVLTGEAVFAPGKVSVANLTLNPSTPSDQVVVSFSFTVVDWEEGAELATEEPIVTAKCWHVVGLDNDWENGIPMTCVSAGSNPGEGVWEAEITYAAGDKFKLRLDDIWAGMKSGWTVYGLGEFDEAYLTLDAGAPDIVLASAGTYKLSFTYPSCRFIVTAAAEPEPEPDVWKVVGLGNDWTWAHGVELAEADVEGVLEADLTLAAGDEFKLNLNNGQTWLGMKGNWSYYGLGDISDGTLVENNAKNIIVKESYEAETTYIGEVHVAFTPATKKFVITAAE